MSRHAAPRQRVPRQAVAAGTVLLLVAGLCAGGDLVFPLDAAATSSATTITAGYNHSCMLRGGKAYCWGDNTYGERGNGSTIRSGVPAAVYTGGVLSGVTLTLITAGQYFTCALSSAGAGYCWGANNVGQLGNNSTANSDVPVAVNTSGVLSGKTITQLSAGGNSGSVCALSSGGAAYCWGSGGLGQLGNNSYLSSSVPVAVNTSGVLSGVTLSSIDAGNAQTCALSSAGAAYCWGAGSSGQLGNSTTSSSTLPVTVTATGVLSGATLSQITAGANFTCAVDSAGTAYCWGTNSTGQDGNTTTTPSTSFAQPVVVSPPEASTLATGLYHACDLRAGKAYCWGDDTYGELGNNTTSTTAQSTPVAVYTGGVLSGVTLTQIVAGHYSTCALSNTGTAYCWGYNSDGELGNNSTTNSDVPVAITVSSALTGKVIAAIYGGYAHDCAVDAAGNAFCWGSNGSGALGNNSATASSVAVAVYTGGALSASTYIIAMGALGYDSSGNASTCALGANGLAYCWGTNTDGELGNNSTTSSNVPVAVYTSGVLSGLTLLQISASSSYFVCVLDSVGAVYCWGQNGDGQLGNGSTTSSDAPVEVVGLVPGAPTSVASFPASNSASAYWAAPSSFGSSGSATGYTATASPGGATCTASGLTCTITGLTNGTTYAVTVVTNTTGGPSYASSPATVTAWPPDTALGAGFSNTCVLQSGLAYCWGANTYGEAGISSTTPATELSPVAVYTGGVLSGLTLTQIVGGEYFTCALSSAGAVYCWGYNSSGGLGNGTTTNSSVPVAVTTSGTPMSGATITQISANQYTVCALSSAGAEYCWGGSNDGQLGNNSTTSSDVPVAVSTSGVLSGLTLVQISAGWQSNCSLASTGAVYCWGDDAWGELGNNSTAQSNVPVAVSTGGVLSGVHIATISTGWTEACAVSSTGAAYCWGNGQYGGLGNNSTAGSEVPVAVSTSGVLSGVTLLQLTNGHQYECALSSTGTSGCFGTGVSGDLGNNNGSANASTAVVVTPQAPLSVTTTAGNTTLAVSWTAPAYLNTGTLTSYTATASPGGATCSSTSATSCTITGLTDGTSYTITVTTTATISGTSAPSIAATGTPVGLESTVPTSLTWSSTASGLNESIADSVSGDQQLTVVDSTGSGAGWHITMSATTFTAGSRTLPNSGAMDVNGSVTSLTGVAPSAACVSSCTLPANTTTYPVALTTAATSPSSYTIYDTSASTGIGAVIIGGSSAPHPVGWWVNVPASAYAGSYTSTVSLTLVSGP